MLLKRIGIILYSSFFLLSLLNGCSQNVALSPVSQGSLPDKIVGSSSSSDISKIEDQQQEGPEDYQSPIDFAELQNINQDIYAWIKIEGTDIDYPILQSSSDDNYYLKRTYEKKESVRGAIFTQVTFNAKDFEDNHTVLYGHNMFKPNGEMFSQLVHYQDKDFFDKYREIIIYLPGKELKYKVFAAYKWTDEHLLYEYNTRNKALYGNYLQTIFNIRDLSANIDQSLDITADDKIITLSTCVTLNGTQRYLVQAVRCDDE